MLECRACVLRCIRAIAGDAATAPSIYRNRLFLTPRLAAVRHASTTRSTSNASRDNGLVPGAQPIPSDNAQKKKSIVIADKKALRTELRYLQDPLKHAQHVHYTLRSDKPEKALDLCRLASKQTQVIVSWNHCIDWHMAKGRVDDAVKIYNEMKKRAQFPDSYTYSLLLRGLAKVHRRSDVVDQSNVVKAVSIYQSMSGPTSRVKPTILHTNAALRVCSAALDMDALWGIAGKLPTSGPGAPDHITYSILLTAIRHSAFGPQPENAFMEQLAWRRQNAIQEGRRIWIEVISKWRSGQIHIDEELVSSMGRLLLIGQRMSDWDDVLNLVQQTMNIERLIAPLGSPGRHTEHIPKDHELVEPEPEAEDSEGYRSAPSTKAFHTVQPLPRDSSHPKRPTTLPYVQPGNATLSLLIDACTVLRIPKIAVAYWDSLTTTHHVQPDLANFHSQLKLLGKNRASAKAVDLLENGLKAANVTPKFQTFRIAMSICMRDRINDNSMSHARRVVEVMRSTSADLDIHTLIQYLNFALTHATRRENGAVIKETIEHLDPIMHNLRSQMWFGKDSNSRTLHATDREAIVLLYQTAVGVVDTMLEQKLVPDREAGGWHSRRRMWTSFIGRATNSVEQQKAKAEARENEGHLSKPREYPHGMQLDKGQRALKEFKWKERGRRSEENRSKADGFRKWNVQGEGSSLSSDAVGVSA